MNDIMKNSPGNSASRQSDPMNPHKMGKRFYLIIDGCRIGPFLAIGPLGRLEKLLRLRGVQIAT